MNGTEPSGNREADRRRYRRTRARTPGAFTSAQDTPPLKRSRRWRRRTLIFRLLLAAFLAAIVIAFYMILRSPQPIAPRSEPFQGLDL